MNRAAKKTLRAGNSSPSTLRQIFLTQPLGATAALVLSLFLFMSAVDAMAQTVKFTSPVTYPAGAPFKITSGDFNRDGKMDLVAGDHTNSNIVMLLGKGDLTRRAP